MPKNNRNGQAAILSDSDYAKLLKQVKNPKHRLFILIGRYTGERCGAICQLQIEDVYKDVTKGEPRSHITFRASTRKADPFGRRRTRQVPVHDQLAVELKAYALKLTKDQKWLFPGWLNPDKPMSVRNTDKFLRAAADKAGLEGVSTHSFRRTLITRLDEAGIGMPTIQEVTGHRDPRALRRYLDVSETRVRQAICSL